MAAGVVELGLRDFVVGLEGHEYISGVRSPFDST